MSLHEEQGKDHLFQTQLEILNELKKQGINPYGQKFETSGSIVEYRETFEEEKPVKLAGRITACRDMGKTKFWDLTDSTGKIQLFLNPKNISSEKFALLHHLGTADFLGVEGNLFKTKTGEISVRVTSLVLLSKALRPLPEKYHGLKDVEARFRQRYLDLTANRESKNIFIQRAKIIRNIRQLLDRKGFLEVETPMLQALYGGAAARPFMTHHNALDMPLFLRIAPELFLKRLLVGGFEKVYELNRNFRNEGLSRRHNPEFTMLEVYAAFDDYKGMMELCEFIFRSCAEAIGKTEKLVLPSGSEISLEKPFQKMSLFDAVKKYTDFGLQDESQLRDLGKKEQIENWETVDEGVILCELFERYVEEKLVEPTFITDFPSVLCPLAKKNPENPRYSDRFEFFVDGQEIANAYSELNDPVEQKLRFEEQLAHQDEGPEKKVDMDYVLALEHGMPPAGGLGIGIDRLVMVLTGAASIREVILFPLMREHEG